LLNALPPASPTPPMRRLCDAPAMASPADGAKPLCGTAGDILVLKNLAPALKLAAPK